MNATQVFAFDSETLLLVYHVVAWLMASLTLVGLWYVRGRYGLSFWVGSFLAAALSQALRPWVNEYWGIFASFSMGHIGGVVSAAFLYLGVRSFLGLPLHMAKVVLIALVAIAGSLTINLNDFPNIYSSILTLSFGAIFRLWAAVDAFHQWRRERSPAWALMLGFLVASACMQVLRALSVQWASLMPEQEREIIHGKMLLIAIVMLVAQGMCVLILVSDAFFRELSRLAEHDVLTGLLNRRGLQQQLLRLQKAVDQAASRQVFLIDVDHFKRINDQCGHAAGDAVLQELSRRLQSMIKASAKQPPPLLARTGGEEFVLICVDLESSEAERWARHLLETVRAEHFQLKAQRRTVTISVGFSTAPCASSFEAQLTQSDAALYAAKAAGRDTWRSADTLPSSEPHERGAGGALAV